MNPINKDLPGNHGEGVMTCGARKRIEIINKSASPVYFVVSEECEIVMKSEPTGEEDLDPEEALADLNPETENLWDEVLERYGCEELLHDYHEWKEENGKLSFEDLKARQKQEIYKLLMSGFFRHCHSPTGANVKQRSLIITEDDLEVGSEIPNFLAVECAKFERYFVWKGDSILILDYEKLEHYIRKKRNGLTKTDMINIAAFDMRLDLLHNDMAKLKPQLTQHLKGYEENLVMKMKAVCQEVLNVCKEYLNNKVRANILKDYVEMLLFDEGMKEEARRKLKGRSMKKFICEMVAALRWFDIFRHDVTPQMLASVMSKKFEGVASKTLQTYIEKFYNAREGRLYVWTKANIEQLKVAPYNPFAQII